MKFRDSASFGKRQEFIAIAELLKRGFDVYQTLVDDQQIDCIIRNEVKGKPLYMDIQIKARSDKAQEKSWGEWPTIKIVTPRPNYFFIFYSDPLDKYWVIPSTVLAKRAYQGPSAKGGPDYTVTLSRCRKSRGSEDYFFEDNEEFEEFIGAYDLMKKFKG